MLKHMLCLGASLSLNSNTPGRQGSNNCGHVKCLGWDFHHLTFGIYRCLLFCRSLWVTEGYRTFYRANILRIKNKPEETSLKNVFFHNDHRQLPLMKLSVSWYFQEGEMHFPLVSCGLSWIKYHIKKPTRDHSSIALFQHLKHVSFSECIVTALV